MGVGGQSHSPAFCPRELPGTRCIRGRMRKISPHWDSIPGTSSPQQVAIQSNSCCIYIDEILFSKVRKLTAGV
jgi:hypothetical protein